MSWSKNVLTYPSAYREIFERLMLTGAESVHRFDSKAEATHFEKSVFGVRYAYMSLKDKEAMQAHEASGFTAERIDDLTVRLCSINDTRRARLAFKALEQRREQDAARGFDPEALRYTPSPTNISPEPLDKLLTEGDDGPKSSPDPRDGHSVPE